MSGRQVTHRPDPETGSLVQIVSPEALRRILDADGDDYSRPDGFADGDEWDTGDEEAVRS